MPLTRSKTAVKTPQPAVQQIEAETEIEAASPTTTGTTSTEGTSSATATTVSITGAAYAEQTESIVADGPLSPSADDVTKESAGPAQPALRRPSSANKRLALAKARHEYLLLRMEVAESRIAMLEDEEEVADHVVSDREAPMQAVDRSDLPYTTTATVGSAIAVSPPPQPQLTNEADALRLAQLSEERVTLSTDNVPPTYLKTARPAGEVAERRRQHIDISELATAIALAARAGQPTHLRQFTELPSYSGLYQEWLSFKAAYNESAASFSNIENLARLRKCLRGRARESVESLLIFSTTPDQIIKTLETRFGRPDAIALTELDRLRTLPRPTDAARDLCIFATKVTNIVATLRALDKVYYLYNPEVTKVTLEKLTPAMRYRWYDFAAEQSSDEPDLLRLARFLQREADRCSPYAQPEAVAQITGDARRQQQKTYATTEDSTVSKYKAHVSTGPKQPVCGVCNDKSHAVAECDVFKSADNNKRWELAKKKRLCFRCLCYKSNTHKCKTIICNKDGCDRTHHRLLHYQARPAPPTDKSETEIVGSTRTQQMTNAFLKIIPVRVSGSAGYVDTFALLDDGSTVTLVDAQIAAQVGADGPVDRLEIETISGRDEERSSRRITLQLRGPNGKKFDVKARTIDRLHLSSQTVRRADVESANHLRGICNRFTYDAARPTLLIGQDNWPLLIAKKVKRGSATQLAASLTQLGWVLHGATTRSLGHQIHYVAHVADGLQSTDRYLNDEMKKLFALESLCIQPKTTRSDPNELALQTLKKYTVERNEGGYETSLIWKAKVELPNNYDGAIKRLVTTEKKIDRDPQLRTRYENNIEALLEKGYAELAPSKTTPGQTWYLPHFAVLNPAKPDKVRVVFDAAARYAGTSLNDHLHSGPDLLQSLPGVIMRFRQHSVAVAADIEEMFLRIGIREEDRDSLRFLWRNRRREGAPLQYRMKSVIFGAACSPCIALYVKNHNAEKHREQYPEAAEAIVRHHYMDDYLQSFATIEEAIKIATDVQRVHRMANFNLSRWASNKAEVLSATSTNQQSNSCNDVTLTDDKQEKVLGLTWRPTTDTLGFNLNFARAPPEIVNGERTPTKREALQTVMSLFDPLGYASPITIQAKQILQDTWRTGTSWDDPLHETARDRWHRWIDDLKQLKRINLPRCHPHLTDAIDRQLHTFVDASELAYAAAVYWRVIDREGRVHVSLAAGKAKVAPLKVTSMPRLELQAAVLGSRLAKTVLSEYQVAPTYKYYWSDSKTALAWLRAGPRTFKAFVAHRVAEIEEDTAVNEWRWVPSRLNVADDATRSVPTNFCTTHRWFTGPTFLYQPEAEWPQENTDSVIINTGEERVHAMIEKEPTLTEALPDVTRFSKWLRLIRATARVLQYIDRFKVTKQRINFSRTARLKEKDPEWRSAASVRRTNTAPAPRGPTHAPKTTKSKYIDLDADYVRRAEQLWVRASQSQSFSADIAALKANRQPPRDSRLKQLSVQIDDTQTVKLRSRIAAATDLSAEQKEPAILDGNHPYTQLYLDWVHKQLAHGTTEIIVNEVRQQYWVLRLRPTAKQIVKRCLACRIKRAQPAAPPTGDHPYNRLGHHRRPFTYVGLDYFGPLSVTVGRRHEKRYVALFTCLTTRALHLEVAASLSSDSAIMALRRFIARRGCPAEIYSDNGTNMHGAEKELRAALSNEASKRAIRWRFICPSAPFMGGCWERLVRSVKKALNCVLNERHPHEECLNTLLAEAEYTVNSRPLTHVSVDPSDEDALTPNHFLLGGSARTPPSGTYTDNDLTGRSQWRRAQRLADHFWSRWLREYLPELQHRREPHGHGKSICIGDIVLIVDGNLPRNTWPRGIVTTLYPGRDGEVRVVDVRTQGGVLRRPTKKIIVLPPTDVPAPE